MTDLDVEAGVPKGVGGAVNAAKVLPDARHGALAHHGLHEDEGAAILEQPHGLLEALVGVLPLAPVFVGFWGEPFRPGFGKPPFPSDRSPSKYMHLPTT